MTTVRTPITRALDRVSDRLQGLLAQKKVRRISADMVCAACAVAAEYECFEPSELRELEEQALRKLAGI